MIGAQNIVVSDSALDLTLELFNGPSGQAAPAASCCCCPCCCCGSGDGGGGDPET